VEIQGLESQRVVEAFGTQEVEETRLRKVSLAAAQAALQARKIKSSLSPIVSVTVAVCTAFVLWRGAGLVLSRAMTAGILTVFLSYLARFFKPVQDLAKMTNAMAQTAVAAERIQAILETDEIIRERANARVPKSLRGEIVFDHVAFRYDAEAPVLRDVSFRIEPGQFVGIVGPTGSGKSTVISLIPRFYDPEAGRVLIDGVDIRDYQLQGLRQQFASCCRTLCCSKERFARTSRTGGRTGPWRRLWMRRSRPTRTSSSNACRMDTRPWWGSGD
jgi:ABC-type multidrug transport system fused ATPase/permease subunit